jgi:hypothetical protein
MQMHVFRPLQGFNRSDHQRYSDMTKRLKLTNILKGVQGYQQNWKKAFRKNGNA